MSVNDELAAVLLETKRQLRHCKMPHWKTAHPRYWYTRRWMPSIQRHVEVPAAWLQVTHHKLLPLFKRWWSDLRGSCVATSAYDHAARHCSPHTTFVVLADIKSFFPSITHQHLIEYLFYPTGLSAWNADLLARLCAPLGCDRLLTGAPISPILADRALHNVDYLLEGTAGYSRYVDDLAFSVYDVGHAAWQTIDALFDTVRSVLQPRFKLNQRKTRVWRVGKDKTVKITGYIVEPGHLPRVPRSTWRELRAGLYRLASSLNDTTAKPPGWTHDLQHLRGLFAFCAETDEDKAAPYKALLETLETYNWSE